VGSVSEISQISPKLERGAVEFIVFLFPARGSGLGARGSGLGARGSIFTLFSYYSQLQYYSTHFSSRSRSKSSEFCRAAS
jgi:hypothetical protein